MADGRPIVKMQGRTGCRIAAAAQPVTRTGRAVLKSIGLSTVQTAYSHRFLRESRMAVLQVLMSWEDFFSSLSLREYFDSRESLVSGEEEVHEATWQC